MRLSSCLESPFATWELTSCFNLKGLPRGPLYKQDILHFELYWEHGKENGNYYSYIGVSIGVILGFYFGLCWTALNQTGFTPGLRNWARRLKSFGKCIQLTQKLHNHHASLYSTSLPVRQKRGLQTPSPKP